MQTATILDGIVACYRADVQAQQITHDEDRSIEALEALVETGLAVLNLISACGGTDKQRQACKGLVNLARAL